MDLDDATERLKHGTVPLWLAGMLVVASAGLGIAVANVGPAVGMPGDGPVLPGSGGQGASPAAHDHGHGDHDHDHADGHGHGHDAPDYRMDRFEEGEGGVPTREQARDFPQHRRILIRSDGDFSPANGVRSGDGTLESPYVIERLHVTGDLYVENTDACFVVREVHVSGQLTLNWNGPCVHVHHSHVRDLRVNENVRRTGYATGGLIEHNVVEVVGQLRHFDGEFRHNEVGPASSSSLWDPVKETAPYMFHRDPRVANVDGFNQGWIHHNTFHGSVDLDFHGHHHGDGFFADHSHYHGDDEDRHGPHNHSIRFTSVRFTHNRVVDDEGYGLRYEDRNHAADDRTAASEVLDDLNDPHVHFTRIEVSNNSVEGAGIWVDVFNADDDQHFRRNPGTLVVADNRVVVRERTREGPADVPLFGPRYQPNVGIHVQTAKEVEAAILRNDLSFEADDGSSDLWPPWDDDGHDGDRHLSEEPQAVLLDGFRDANVTVADNVARNFYIGIRGTGLDGETHWRLAGNDWGGAEWPVYYDEGTVENPPDEG